MRRFPGLETCFRGRSLAFLLLSLAGILPAVPHAAGLPDVVARVKQGVVGVGTFSINRTPPGRFAGTGFAVGDGRTIVTNYHVLRGAQADEPQGRLCVFVVDEGMPTARLAEVVGEDAEHDLAVLRISDQPLRPLQLGKSGKVREGERYVFTGFPLGGVLGLHHVTHEALVSAIARLAVPAENASQLDADTLRALRSPQKLFQLDATVFQGNSGSPLYSAETGEVVAVINMVASRDDQGMRVPVGGISFAIPVEAVHRLLERLAAEAAAESR